jgi:copper chaperone
VGAETEVPHDRFQVIAFQVSDMTCARCASAVTRALKAIDHRAVVRVDLATCTVEIEASSASARQLSDAIKQAGYLPVAA